MSVNKPLISVYTPTYNRSKILVDRAIKSVLAQTFKDFEYIIVGDGCTDDTEKRVKAIKDSRIRFVNMKKRVRPASAEIVWFVGPTHASNKALSMVRGSYIARCDDDDIWTKDHLEILLNELSISGNDFISARTLIDKGMFNKEKDDCFHVESTYYGWDKDNVRTPLIGATSTWLYKSEWKHIKYDPNCYKRSINRVNDTEFIQRLWKSGCSMSFLNKVVNILKPRPGEKEIGRKAVK